MDDDSNDEDSGAERPTQQRQEINEVELIACQSWKLSDVSRSVLDSMIMDYFIIEGFKEAAEEFIKESDIKQSFLLETIKERDQIRKWISEGQIADAISLINHVDNTTLNRNKHLLFRLYQQEFIELLRNGDVNHALSFATDKFYPLMESNVDFLREIEQTMSLIIFPQPHQTSLGFLMDPSRRQKLAGDVNSAIMLQQCQRKEPEINYMLRVLVAAQAELQTVGVKFPTVTDITA